jgi:DNA-binding NtrC family response regulator
LKKQAPLPDLKIVLDGAGHVSTSDEEDVAIEEPVASGQDQAKLRALVSKAVEAVERHFIAAALKAVQGNRTAAARLLGLSRQSLYIKLARYGIDTVEERPLAGVYPRRED